MRANEWGAYVVMQDKPWASIIPEADMMSFPDGANANQRPIAAGTRPAIIIVDMTQGFVGDASPYGWRETGLPAIEANRQLLANGRRAGVPIFFTKAFADRGHVRVDVELSRWKIDGTVRQSPEMSFAEDVIVDALAPSRDEVVICKGDKPSAFFGTPLTSQLIRADIDTVIVSGMTTSGCVRATVLDAFMLNFHVIIPFECAADRSQISHKVSLFDLHMKYADVVSLEETAEYIKRL